MSARDLYHDVVRQALQGDGWRITHDPYRIPVGLRNLYVDLGAERMIAAERDSTKIALEIKSFVGDSEVHELEEALGQYLLYLPFLNSQDAERRLYLAISLDVYDNLFQEPIGQRIVAEYGLNICVFDPVEKRICQWLPPL